MSTYFSGKNQRWNCESAGFYRSYKAGPADFSEDGSLLAVAFENHLTLWDPDTNALRLTLEQRSGDIRCVFKFILSALDTDLP